MNRRNKTKAASSSSQSKQAQPLRQTPAKASPLPKPQTPPPPKPTPSQLLRQEWHNFEIWLKARREEKDKRVSDRINEIISPRGKSRFQRPAASTDTINISKFEADLNVELAERAREEWFRRVGATRLDLDEWTDITPEEMQAVEAAFIPPEPTITPMSASFSNGAKTSQERTSFAPMSQQQSWYPSPPGAWDTPTAVQGKGAKPQQTQPVQSQSMHTPILSDTRSKLEAPRSGLPNPELLWEMNMSKNPSSDVTSLPSKNPASEARKTATKSAPARSGTSLTGKPLSPDSPWEAHMSKEKDAPPMRVETSTDNLWGMHMAKANATERPPTPPESPWTAQMSKKSVPPPVSQKAVHGLGEGDSLWNAVVGSKSAKEPISRVPDSAENPWSTQPTKKASSGLFSLNPNSATSNPMESLWEARMRKKNIPISISRQASVAAADPSESIWNMHIASRAPAEPPALATPLPAPDDTSTAPSYSYVYLSPVLVELEEESPPDLELLPEKTVEDAIVEFHKMAAEADIELRRTLINNKDSMDAQQHDELLEEHLRTMELCCRAVVDNWKRAREQEKQRRAAEEKKKLAEAEKKRLEAEKQRKLAEAKKNTGKGKWAIPTKPDSPVAPVKSPEPQVKRTQAKQSQIPRSNKQKATVEDIASDTEQSEVTSFGQSAKDSLDTDSDNPRANFPQPAKTLTSNFLSSVWGKTSSSRPSSPASGVKLTTETKLAGTLKNPFAPQGSALPNRDSSSWDGRGARTSSSSGAQGKSLWQSRFGDDEEEEAEEEEDTEGPSAWQSATRVTGIENAAWSFAMSTLSGERAATPAKPSPSARGVGNVAEKDAARAWMPASEESIHRSMSRGPFADGNAPSGTDPRFATWQPARGSDLDAEHDNPLKKMADLALQNLWEEVADPEGNEPTEIMNAMSMYTKAAISSNRKKGGRR